MTRPATSTIASALLLVGGAFSLDAYAAKTTVSCPITSTTDFVVYTGSGASSLSQSWMFHFLDWWRAQEPNAALKPEYVKLSATQVGACNLADRASYRDLRMYIQPGGDAYLAQRWIGSGGKTQINSFLANGGSYFGACAGWYFAAGTYVWQDVLYAHPDLLGAYPARVEGSIREVADYDVGTGNAVTTLNTGRRALYWGGPTIGYKQTSTGAGTVQARFSYQNLPAVVTYNNMLLTSVHLEAFENDGFSGLSTSERESNYRYLAGLVNQTAGTSFTVPVEPQPTLPACSDGTDNDSDALIDLLDPGCTGATDNDERDNTTGPQDVLFDTFESGFAWTVSGAGAPWTRRTGASKVYDGSYGAGVIKTGAGVPSYMERTISLAGYASATLTYVRRLMGMDSGDEFSVAYFDGRWRNLELLGRGSENGGFVAKSFSLPTTATRIRFRCDAGAVSEGCFVDNVRVVAQ